MPELPNKTFTKFGSPVESNLSIGEHMTVHKMLEYCEEQMLKQTKGGHTLHDVLSSNNPVQTMKDVLLQTKHSSPKESSE